MHWTFVTLSALAMLLAVWLEWTDTEVPANELQQIETHFECSVNGSVRKLTSALILYARQYYDALSVSMPQLRFCPMRGTGQHKERGSPQRTSTAWKPNHTPHPVDQHTASWLRFAGTSGQIGRAH